MKKGGRGVKTAVHIVCVHSTQHLSGGVWGHASPVKCQLLMFLAKYIRVKHGSLLIVSWQYCFARNLQLVWKNRIMQNV